MLFEMIMEHSDLINNLYSINNQIYKIVDAIMECFKNGGKLLLCGNGGSAADCQHVAGEFIGLGLPAIALTTDSSVITSIGNDEGFENIFSLQVAALYNPQDILFCISTSGWSTNVKQGKREAMERGLLTIGFSGEQTMFCDYNIVIPSTNTQRIQECHIFIWHVIYKMVEERLGTN